MGVRTVSPAWRLAYRIGVFIAALVSWPLALTAGALFSGLCAGWAANLLAPDRTRSALLPIVGVSIAASAIIALAGMALSLGGMRDIFPNLFAALLASLAVITIDASIAAWHFRRTGGGLAKDLLTMLGLLAAAAGATAGTVVTTCSLVSCTP
jgi:hypothetical protein